MFQGISPLLPQRKSTGTCRWESILRTAGALVLLLSVIVAPCVANPPNTARISRYAIYSHGMRIGEMSSSCTLDGQGEQNSLLSYRNSTSVSANLLFSRYRMNSREEAVVGTEGTLRYRHSNTENEVTRHVEGMLDHGRFRVTITEGKASRTLSFPRESYDFTTMECPEVRLKREGDQQTLRMLDLEHLEIVTRHYRWLRTEEVRVGGSSYTCRVIDFEDGNKSCRRWIKPEGVGIMLVRQDGRSRQESYSVRMISSETQG